MAASETEFLLNTPLGQDVLLLHAFTGQEGMSRLFEFELDMTSSDGEIDPTKLVGKPVSFSIVQGETTRPFSGVVAKLVFGGADVSGVRRYRARVKPWLWLLTKRSGYRIFQNQTVVEIVEQVFNDAGATRGSAYDFSKVSGTLLQREYCVQFGETDFNFVSRLLEDEGIYYFFRFEGDSHVMVLADGTAAHTDLAPLETPFHDGQPGLGQISSWEHSFEFVSGKWSMRDYDFVKPTVDLWSETATVVPLADVKDFERYEYPGGYDNKAAGAARAKIRMEAEEAAYDVAKGEGGCLHFQLGGKFELVGHSESKAKECKYTLIEIGHTAVASSTGAEANVEGVVYTNTFACIPESVSYRPARATPRPCVPGPQTAIVVGPSGEEIHTDEYGRIKVQFHWDREGKYDEKSSCWIRVAQSVAGKEWGTLSLPRVAQEVIVEFLDGNPDRPIVTGALYNANTKPPYPLPGDKTQTGIKSRSTKGAPKNAFNELRFENLTDSEYIYIKAQKDEHHHVQNDRYDRVDNDAHFSSGGRVLESIQSDKHFTMEGSLFSKIEGEANEAVKGDRNVLVKGTDSLSVRGSRMVSTSRDLGQSADGEFTLYAGGGIHLDAVGDIQQAASGDIAIDALSNTHIKGGSEVLVEAGVSLTLKAGPSFITIGPGGIDISGPMVKINGGGLAGSQIGALPLSPSRPSGPAEPEPPTLPMNVDSMDGALAYENSAQKTASSEQHWTSVENAAPTPQAAALESAAESGQPLSDT